MCQQPRQFNLDHRNTLFQFFEKAYGNSLYELIQQLSSLKYLLRGIMSF